MENVDSKNAILLMKQYLDDSQNSHMNEKKLISAENIDQVKSKSTKTTTLVAATCYAIIKPRGTVN